MAQPQGSVAHPPPPESWVFPFFCHLLAKVRQVAVQGPRVSSEHGLASLDLARKLGCHCHMEGVLMGNHALDGLGGGGSAAIL